jgi:hypothetical protein
MNRRWTCGGAMLCMGVMVLAGWADEPSAGSPAFQFTTDEATGRITLTEGDRPVFTYNLGEVPVPDGVTGPYAVARCHYIHPLYGLNGEVLTRDYPPPHPHHRGIYWAWPEVTWKGEMRDLHALQGMQAKPVRVVRQQATAEAAVLEIESRWLWDGEEPIVREWVVFTVTPMAHGRRVLDVELRFQALVEGVTLARRAKAHYGGLNIRCSPRAQQQIVQHTDPEGVAVRRAWACLSGIPADGTQPVSLVILQHPGNPGHPGDWVEYPEINWLQPTFPAKGAVHAMKTDAALVLRYRLMVQDGRLAEAELEDLWSAYQGRP